MTREDLAKVAEVIEKRKRQRLDRTVDNAEQEFNRLFLWFMMKLEEEIEHVYPPQGKIVLSFEVVVEGERRTYVRTTFIKSEFVSLPQMLSSEFVPIVAQCVNFIATLPGYEIINRFPKDNQDTIDKFMIVIKY